MFAVNDGVRIGYDIVGNGLPLVLQHGSPQDSDDWRQSGYVGPLSECFQVVLVDARGHGRSDKPHDREAYALDRLVGDVVAVLDDAGIERTHYWGYSFGGWIGLGLLVKAPQRLRKAVLGGAHPYERKATPYQSDGRNPEEFMRELGKRMGMDFESFPAELRKKLLQFDCRALVANQRDRPSHEAPLPGIRTPCLMYAGDKDGLYEQARKGAAAIPDCPFVTVPGAHVQAFNNSAAILPHVLKFLAE
jgi:pimeloyl-ACP methyl ester carboxylesterase